MSEGKSPTTAPKAGKTDVVSIRISADLKARLNGLRIKSYSVKITDVVERGIVLALEELERFNNAK